MKVNARKPLVRITWANGTFRIGEVNHTTMAGEYNITLLAETKPVQVPGDMVEFLLDLPQFRRAFVSDATVRQVMESIPQIHMA